MWSVEQTSTGLGFSFTKQARIQKCSDNSYVSAVFDLTETVHRRSRLFPYHFYVIFNLSPLGFRFRKAGNVAHEHTGMGRPFPTALHHHHVHQGIAAPAGRGADHLQKMSKPITLCDGRVIPTGPSS
ncbi:unnamed protein product [Lampetra planeri]